MADWWPDWRGETVVIVASGPSQRREDAILARSRARVIAINNSWLLCPDADVLYAADRGWWEREGDGYGQHALREFAGLKLAGRSIDGTRKIGIEVVNEMLWTGVEIGGGGNSSYQALNLAVLWGAARVILTGVDCKAQGEHWHGRHPSPLGQHQAHTFGLWTDAFGKLAPRLAERGVEVVNASRDTALTCFPCMKLEDALERRRSAA